jgi:hypothetical protein
MLLWPFCAICSTKSVPGLTLSGMSRLVAQAVSVSTAADAIRSSGFGFTSPPAQGIWRKGHRMTEYLPAIALHDAPKIPVNARRSWQQVVKE